MITHLHDFQFHPVPALSRHFLGELLVPGGKMEASALSRGELFFLRLVGLSFSQPHYSLDAGRLSGRNVDRTFDKYDGASNLVDGQHRLQSRDSGHIQVLRLL